MISFNEVPSALRYPGVYIEIDGSQAGLGGDIPSVLLVGQKFANGSAPAGEITLIASVQDAIDKFGGGSMLAKMAEKYRNADSSLDLYALPYSDNPAGVFATGTITVSTQPTSSGVIYLYVGGNSISVGVTSGSTTAQVASAIAEAINAAGVHVSASSAASIVTLTAKHKGTSGNDIDLRLNLYGEKLPSGLVLSIVGMANGAGDPAPGDLTSIIGDNRWFKYVALGVNDAATLAAWHTESQRRYKVPIQAGFRVFTAYRGDYLSAAAFGGSKNYEHIVSLSVGVNPVTTYESAAILAAAAAPKLYNNPVMSLEGIKLFGMIGLTYHNFTQSNSLLFKGMSLMEVAKDGSCYIKRLISMYQYRPDGSADDAYLDINIAEVMERIRYEQRIGAIKKFRGTVAAKTDEGYRPGLRITTEDGVKAFLLSLYKNVLMADYGWVQSYDYYKTTLVVEQDSTNPSRFNFKDNPVVNSPFYILAGRASFRKAVPQY